MLARLRTLDAEAWRVIRNVSRWKKRWLIFLDSMRPQVLLTNGVDEAIHLLCSTYLDPGDEAMIVVPTFAMYAIFARAEGRAGSGAFGRQLFFSSELLSRISPRTRLIAVANPNNPTGTSVAREVLLRIARARRGRRSWWMKRISNFTGRR